MKEKLQIGQLDQVDLQIHFQGYHYDDYVYIGGVENYEKYFLWELRRHLVKGLDSVNWKGINLRPTSVQGPWHFFWKRQGTDKKCSKVSVNIIPILNDEKDEGQEYYDFTSPSKANLLQREMLEGAPQHRFMSFSILEKTPVRDFNQTSLAFELDMINSLPSSCRIGIVLAKALVKVSSIKPFFSIINIIFLMKQIKTAYVWCP